MAAIVVLLFFALALFLLIVGIRGLRKKAKAKLAVPVSEPAVPASKPTPVEKVDGTFPTFTFTMGPGGIGESEPKLKAIGLNEWEITSPWDKSFTIYNAPERIAQKLFELLKNRFGAWIERTVPIEMLIHESDMRCHQIDSFLSQCTRELDALYARRESKSDWIELSELDRKDELRGIRHDYIEHLVERPSCNIEALLEGTKVSPSSDAELIAFYGVETLTPYMRCVSGAREIQKIPADHYLRHSYDKLVEKGLARKGKDIPIEEILPSMTLKDMNEVAKDLNPKPFTRKQKAIEFLQQQPNMRDLLSKVISFNQLFQPLPLDSKFDGIDLTEIAAAWQYDTELGSAMISAYDRGPILYVDELRRDDAMAWRKSAGIEG